MLRFRILPILLAMTILFACPLLAAPKAPVSEEEKILYTLGVMFATNLDTFDLSAAELEMFQQGLTDALLQTLPAVDPSRYKEKARAFAMERHKLHQAKAQAAARELLENPEAKGGVKSPTGLIYYSLKEGQGTEPRDKDRVRLHYRGTLLDGREFDSSYKRNKPIDFRLDGVIKCWTEGVQKMKPGGKAKLVCPPAIAYGENGAGDLVPPNATLVFEVELLEVFK